MWQSILADTAPTLWLPRGASTVSGPVDTLFNWILWICIFFFFLVTILLVLFVVMYRHRPGVKRDVAAGHNTPLELNWTLVPSCMISSSSTTRLWTRISGTPILRPAGLTVTCRGG